jgi:hypothetical protein
MSGAIDETRRPVATLGVIGRLRVIEATIPSSAATEQVIDAPFDRVWSFVADLERSVAAFDPLVRRIRIRSRTVEGAGERIDLQAWQVGLPVAMPFDVHLEPGLCLMRARYRLFFVGMAAAPEGNRTRFRHVEGIPLPGSRLLRPLSRRATGDDVAGIVREVDGPAD